MFENIGEMVVLLGRGIGPSPGVSASGFLGAIGTSTGGVQVFFDEIAAPVLYASSDEVDAQAPFEIAGRSNVLVNVKYGGNDSNSIQLQVIDAIPGIFTVKNNPSRSDDPPGTVIPVCHAKIIALRGKRRRCDLRPGFSAVG